MHAIDNKRFNKLIVQKYSFDVFKLKTNFVKENLLEEDSNKSFFSAMAFSMFFNIILNDLNFIENWILFIIYLINNIYYY